jgi:hypothetical protein
VVITRRVDPETQSTADGSGGGEGTGGRTRCGICSKNNDTDSRFFFHGANTNANGDPVPASAPAAELIEGVHCADAHIHGYVYPCEDEAQHAGGFGVLGFVQTPRRP